MSCQRQNPPFRGTLHNNTTRYFNQYWGGEIKKRKPGKPFGRQAVRTRARQSGEKESAISRTPTIARPTQKLANTMTVLSPTVMVYVCFIRSCGISLPATTSPPTVIGIPNNQSLSLRFNVIFCPPYACAIVVSLKY